MIEHKLKLRGRSYPIVTGYQILDRLGAMWEQSGLSGRVFVVFDAQVFALHGGVVRRYLKKSGIRTVEFVIAPGERSKTFASYRKLLDFFLSENIARNDMILAVGGGVVSDLTGLAAATVLRGVDWAVVPTSLLGMVDAAIGGKTGINHSRGKNLVGAFWQPRFVLVDTCFLHTLPERHLAAGMGEVAKYAGLAGGRMLQMALDLDRQDFEPESELANELVARSAAYKARIVAADEREAGRRMLLNLGHTVGHAIETAAGHGRILHGQAVVYGLWAACYLSTLTGVAPKDSLADYSSYLESLAMKYPKRSVGRSNVLAALRLDKKRQGAKLRFVLLERTGRPIISDKPRSGQIRQTVDATLRQFQLTGEKNA